MKFVLAFVFASNAIFVSGQEPAEFGDISVEDFRTTSYDSFASVIIYNKGVYVGGFQPTIERHIRIKINKKNTSDNWGDFRLGNYFETTTKVSAATHYLQEGKVVSEFIEKDAIFKDVKSNREKIVSFPNLRDGCILELKYKSNLYHPGIPTWFIQEEVPVLWNEYLLVASQKLTYVTYGDFQPSIYDPKYKGIYYRWVFENIDAFRTEPLMPAAANYYPRIEFWHRQPSWTRISYQYLRLYSQWLHEFEPIFSKRKLKTQLDSLEDPLEKIKLISDHIKENYTWSGYDAYLPNRYSKMFEERKGNSGELNILLYGMLDWAGLNPQFVLSSTKSNGLVRKEIPSESQFNYVLCRVVVNGRQYLLDATDLKLPFQVAPSRCMNSEGLIVHEKDVQWITLQSETVDKVKGNAFFSISDDLMLKGRCTVVSQGYVALEEQRKYDAMGQDDYERESIPNRRWMSDSASITTNAGSPLVFTLNHYGSAGGNISTTGNRILINPFILHKEEANPFIDATRDFPVQLDRKVEKTMMFNVSIPTGYEVETLPGSEAIALADKSISASVKALNDGKSVVIIYSVNIQKTWFEQEEYGNLRAFFDRLIAKQNEMIVLVKQ